MNYAGIHITISYLQWRTRSFGGHSKSSYKSRRAGTKATAYVILVWGLSSLPCDGGIAAEPGLAMARGQLHQKALEKQGRNNNKCFTENSTMKEI